MYIAKLLSDESFESRKQKLFVHVRSGRHGIKADKKRKVKLKISNASDADTYGIKTHSDLSYILQDPQPPSPCVLAGQLSLLSPANGE